MPKHLTDAAIQELSLVFAQKDGVEWAPRNKHARVLAVKAGNDRREGSFLGDVWDKITAFRKKSASADAIAESASEQAANIISYEVLCNLIGQLNYDLSMIFGTSDAFTDEEKSVAVQRCLDGFLAATAKLMPVLLGNGAPSFMNPDEKAGARHSKADSEKIAAVGDNLAKLQKSHDKMGKAIAAAQDAHQGLTPDAEDAKDGGSDEGSEKSAPIVRILRDGEEVPEGAIRVIDGAVVIKNDSEPEVIPEAAEAVAEAEPEEQPEEKSAPVAGDTEAKAGESDMTPDEINALVAKASAAAAEAAVAAVKAEAQTELAAAKADAAASKAALDAVARKAGAASVVTEEVAPANSRLQKAIKAAMRTNPQSDVI